MALTPGTRLGVFEITAQIGEGGMGQVYRATDTTLGRQVAMKILPDAFAADPERMARFEREAKTLASLNHPNIAAIYAVEKSGGMHALVMELVEGDDLSQRIARGAIPIDEALPIAKQIAEALEAAHEQGIIHRDLKPANVKVRPDGTVKVLDFGLAKAMEPAAASSPSVSMSPTITSPAMMTGVGMILGTAAYMAPEQARGKAVDKRADIWAFGCVLYEMLTARRAFGGEDVTATLARVLEREPDLHAIPSTVPVRVIRTLGVCLQKDPQQRAHDIADVRLALDGAFDATAGGGISQTDMAGGNRNRAVLVVAAVAAVLAIALAVPAIGHLREATVVVAPEIRTEIATPPTVDPASFALSPDGRRLVFTAINQGRSQLWLRPLASATAQPLPQTEGALYPFWSPDSRTIAFFTRTALLRLDTDSGALRMIATIASSSPRGGAWSEDGTILFSRGGNEPLYRTSASGGAPTPATMLGPHRGHRFPQFLPGGRQFLFQAIGDPGVEGIYVGSLDSSLTKLVIDTPQARGFYANGLLFWLRGKDLVAKKFDPGRTEVTGEVITIASGVAVDRNNNAAISVSASGLLTYRGGAAEKRQLQWFDRKGQLLGMFGSPDESGLSYPRLAPDGKRVAITRSVEGNSDIWVLDGTRMSRFTFDAAAEAVPVWSSDGTQIVFRSNRGAKRRTNIYVKPTGGVANDRLLFESDEDKTPTDYSSDGRWLVYHAIDRNGGLRDLWILPLFGDQKPWPFQKTVFDERQGAFSPDGQWIAYMSNESGAPNVFIRPFRPQQKPDGYTNAGIEQWQISTNGGLYPRWRSDGKELYFIGSSGEMMAATIKVSGERVEAAPPAKLFDTRIVGSGDVDSGQGRQYDAGRDGRFLINTLLDDTSAPITLLMNWNTELKK